MANCYGWLNGTSYIHIHAADIDYTRFHFLETIQSLYTVRRTVKDYFHLQEIKYIDIKVKVLMHIKKLEIISKHFLANI